MEAGLRHHASEERNSEEDRHPHLQGGDRAENRECDIKGPVRKEVRFISYVRTGISYKRLMNNAVFSKNNRSFALQITLYQNNGRITKVSNCTGWKKR